MATCKQCGTQLSSYQAEGDLCNKCFSRVHDKRTGGQSPVGSDKNVRFGTLGCYIAGLIALGWIQVACGLLGALVALFTKSGWIGLALGLAVAVAGLFQVIAGQAFQCFVRIESNTSKTVEVLERIEKRLFQQ